NPVVALVDQGFRVVPGAAGAGARKLPVLEAVEVLEDAILIAQGHGIRPLIPGLGEVRERRRATRWAAGLPADLGTRLWRVAGGEAIEHVLEQLGGEVLVGIPADLHHRRIGTDPETLDLLPREIAVLGRSMRLLADAPLADRDKRLCAAQHAG